MVSRQANNNNNRGATRRGGRPEAFPSLRGYRYCFGYRALPVLWQEVLATEKKKNHQRGVGRTESDRGGVAVLSGSPWRVKK